MPHSARCWRCVVLAACWPYFSLLSFFPVFFSVFPASPSICGILGRPWCPPASSASGQGEQGGGQPFVKLSFMFLIAFYPTPCSRARVPPSLSIPVCGRSPRDPCAPPEQAYPVRALFSVEVALARHHPCAEGSREGELRTGLTPVEWGTAPHTVAPAQGRRGRTVN